MNYGISVLFRFIPLLMALICFFFGGYIFAYGNDEARWVAGPVVFSLGVLCIALFATAATIDSHVQSCREIFIARHGVSIRFRNNDLGYLLDNFS